MLSDSIDLLALFGVYAGIIIFFGGEGYVFPQTGLPVGFYLRKKIDWTRWWARWAWLGADLALLGALGWVGRGVWPCWGLAVLAGLGVLAVLPAGWVGRGVGRAGRAVGVGFGRAGAGCWACWACWARWLGWAWCWAWGLAVLGALGWGGRGVGDGGRADWVGRGVQSRKVYYRSTK